MIECGNIILGAGISGLGAAFSLRKNKKESILLEARNTYGGLCSSFTIQGFTFDRFVHLSFTKEQQVREIFKRSSPDIICHIPNPYNIYKDKWVKHPAQNNLYPLDWEEKKQIIDSFKKRPNLKNDIEVRNYEDWLRIQYGDYFAEHFPMVYARKYWMCAASDLETEWIGSRLYQPSLDEVIRGCQTDQTPVTYYAKEMYYPQKGGYKAFLKELVENASVEYNCEINKIDSVNKVVYSKDGRSYKYERLVSSLPLPEVINMLSNPPEAISVAVSKLNCTSGYHISIALRGTDIPPYLWWYIYNEDILAARVYSPSLKSASNVPAGCSSLQMEVYCKENQYSEQELLAGTVGRLIELNIIKKENILFTHIGFEKYANVIFDQNIYESRKIVRDYLSAISIDTIGRFGEWDYLWSDQSLLSGMRSGKK